MNSEKYFLTKHTIKNPSFFDTVKISKDYITNHNKKYYFFLIKFDFKLISIMIFFKICSYRNRFLSYYYVYYFEKKFILSY